MIQPDTLINEETPNLRMAAVACRHDAGKVDVGGVTEAAVGQLARCLPMVLTRMV